MGLKDTWVDKKDGVDINSADDINEVAHAVIELENQVESGGGNGEDGFSPIVSVEKIEGGNRVVIIDTNGEKTFDVMDGTNGQDGQDGVDGKDGTSVTVESVTESAEDGGENVATFSDGKTLIVKNGSKGSKGDPYTLTDTDKAVIVRTVIETLGGNPIFGIVDKDNNIILSGNLADGDYTVKYEMEDGSTVDIGNLVLDTNVYYSVTNNLTNCANSNSASEVVEGESYMATITANDGYELKSVSVTMGGVDISHAFEDKGVINIVYVTGNIAITAVAEAKAVEAEPTNFMEYNATNTLDWDLFCNDARIGSDGKYRSSTTQNVTNYIPVQNGDIVYWHDMPLYGQFACLYSSDKTTIASQTIPNFESQGYIADATVLDAATYEGQLTITNASAAYIRFTIMRKGYTSMFEDNDGIVNIKRNGEWL